MGWTFRCDPRFKKADLIAELTSDAHWGAGWRVLAHSVCGNNLWTVIEKPDGTRFIALDLLQAGNKAHGEGWGHKDLCESMGPSQVDCPLKFLDMVPMPESEYAAGWRESVRAHHKRKTARAAVRVVPGMACTIYGKHYTVVMSAAPRRGWIVQDDTGARYRAARGIEPRNLVDPKTGLDVPPAPATPAPTYTYYGRDRQQALL